MGRLSGQRLYEVFARHNREDRFEHIGTVTASSADLARVYAWQIYDEEKWFEMTIAPRSAFESVNRDEIPFTLSAEERL